MKKEDIINACDRLSELENPPSEDLIKFIKGSATWNYDKNKEEPVYHIKTTSRFGELNYFTNAKSSKQALNKLIYESQDFNSLKLSDDELTIIISKLNQ